MRFLITRHLWPSVLGACLATLILVQPVVGQDNNVFVERRTHLATRLQGGLVILPARIAEKTMQEPGWVQDPTFQYFTGLLSIPGGILVVDATTNDHVLFAPGPPMSFGIPLQDRDLLQREDLIARSGLDAVLPMERFLVWVTHRLANPSGPSVIFLDEPRRPALSTIPEVMPPVSGWIALWKHSLQSAFPDAEFQSAATVIRNMRWQKSPEEVAHLRRNGLASAAALRAGMKAIASGKHQRLAEAAVVSTCLEAGTEGPSFWPWVMTGPNAHLSTVVGSFYDYQHLGRAFEPVDLVRVDIGCTSGGYGGDVGRTVPVSGRFSDEQALVWDLLIEGYKAGVAGMQPGVSLDAVAEASRAAIRTHQGQSSELDALIETLTAPTGIYWHIHGVGIESGEAPGNVLVEGAVLAFEPMISLGEHAYYLEDMWLITPSGAENLTPGLPTTRREIETFLTE